MSTQESNLMEQRRRKYLAETDEWPLSYWLPHEQEVIFRYRTAREGNGCNGEPVAMVDPDTWVNEKGKVAQQEFPSKRRSITPRA